MNTQKPRNSYRFAVLLLAAALIPAQTFAVGAGIVVPPRVIIVFDTSTSMQVAPDDQFGIVFDQNSTGGDYDPATDPNGVCYSKFCIAKKVVYQTLPQYSSDARIGLATYFQFLVKYGSPNTQYTQCYYDEMYKAGVTQTFTSTTDYGAVSTQFPDSLLGKCINNPQSQYAVTKTGSATTNQFRCADYKYPAGTSVNFGAAPPTAAASQVNGGGSACQANTAYGIVYSGPIQWNTPSSGPTATPSQYVEQAIGPAATTCPAAVPVSGGLPTGPASTTLTAPYTVGTALNNWAGLTAGECTTTAGAPCQMFSASSTYRQDNAQNSWFGLYTKASFTPVRTTGTTPPLSANLVSQTATDIGTVCTGNNCTTGLTAASATACLPTGTYTGGQTWNGTFGIPKTNAVPFTSNIPGGYTETTPGRTNPPCSAAEPCQITLVQQVTANPTINTTIYDNAPTIPAPAVVTALANDTNGGNYYWRLPSSGCAATITGQTNGNSFLTGHQPAGCTGAANMDCSLTLVSASTPESTGCTTPSVRYDNATQPACVSAIGSFSYVSTPGTDLTSTQTLPPGSTCSSSFTVGAMVPAGTSGCPSGGTSCYTKSVTSGTGSATFSGWQGASSPPPTGFTGSPAGTQSTGTTWSDPTAGCPASGAYHSTDSSICGAAGTPCDVTSNGLQTFSQVGETYVKKCQYSTQQYRWSANQVTCTLKFPNVSWAAPTTGPVCTYSRKQWNENQPGTTTYQCRYSAPYVRNDFVTVSQRWCEYYRMRTVFETDTFLYTYQYQTTGGELLTYRDSSGNWQAQTVVQPPTSANECATAYNNSTGFAATNDCPPTIDKCAGNTTFCKLRWGSPRGSGDTGSSTYRFQYSATRDSRMCVAADAAATAPVVEPAVSSIITANTVSGPTPALETTCRGDGQASNYDYRLFSDWYDPPTQNSLSNVSTTPVGAMGTWAIAAPSWSNQAYKTSGWSAQGSGIQSDGGVFPTPSQVFVNVADDSVTDPTPLQSALSKCQLPTSANVDPNTLVWSNTGACMVQDHYQNSAGMEDFTPLYGSIVNATDYISNLRASDTPSKNTCRKYYVILATDGAEATPSHYESNPASLTSAVSTLCGGLDSNGSCLNASTYVIAFGNQATGTANTMMLDAMAAAGSTGASYASADQLALETALQQVFNQITEGTYSRSKPAISTDGTRLYASQFSKCGGTLGGGCKADHSEDGMWKGFLYSYGITSNGLITEWEMSTKVNAQSDASRVIKTDLAGTVTDFAVGNAALNAVYASGTGYPGLLKLPPDDITKFIRNGSLAEPFYYDHTAAEPVNTAIRDTRVGDIQHSGAVVIGPSPSGSEWGGSSTADRTAYQAWQASVINRPTRVLVGSNDGLLHGINEHSTASICSTSLAGEQDPACPNGSEAWAWVPSQQLQQMYGQVIGHEMGVDGTPAVSDVCGNVTMGVASDATSCSQTQWKTVAIGTMREGGTSMVGLQLADDGTTPTFLYNFTDPNLGETWSTPAIGRASVGGQEHFVAVFGGGHRSATMPATVGQSMYAIDALSGQLFAGFTGVGASGNEMAGRPGMFRRPVNPYLDTIVSGGSDGRLQTMRFAGPDGTQLGSSAQWVPKEFFDPTATKDRLNVGGAVTPVETVVIAADGGFGLNAVGTLPLLVSPPIYNRPKAIAVFDTTGNTGDYFVGTGDAVAIEQSSTIPTNYFYAIHDDDAQSMAPTAPDDGHPLWVVQMPTRCIGGSNDRNICTVDGNCPSGSCGASYEQIVSEPAFISGAIIVASYLPPSAGAGCAGDGDTVLYSFDPTTGALVPTLGGETAPPDSADGGVQDAGVTPPGTTTSVSRLPGVGIPSDLLVINDTLFLATSAGGVIGVKVTPVQNTGDLRSFRRIR